MEKYYKPDFEDFHIGMEYEVSPYKLICTSLNIDIISGSTYDCPIKERKNHTFSIELARVKYLDREDIESLGFVHIGDDSTRNGFVKDNINIDRWNNGNVLIYLFRTQKMFEGTIKNKSELKVLLKQLGIDGSV